MKKTLVVLLCLCFLNGCAETSALTDRAISLRSALQNASGCSFDTEITADYGDKTYTFAMGCQFDAHGNLSFTVTHPQSIAGITGVIEDSVGKLTFDEHALAFPLLADGQVTPVSAPWLLYKSLLGGYLHAVVEEEELLHLVIDDSYADDALQLDIWLGEGDRPVMAQVLYENRRILSIRVDNFQIL